MGVGVFQFSSDWDLQVVKGKGVAIFFPVGELEFYTMQLQTVDIYIYICIYVCTWTYPAPAANPWAYDLLPTGLKD